MWKSKARQREYNKQYYREHRDKFNAQRRKFHQENRDIDNAAMRAYTKERRRQIRLEVFQAYGGQVCACCGETEEAFLTIDHVDGGGNQHRKGLRNRGGSNFYEWLRKNGFPPGYQVLCMNCNFAKGQLGYCPHQRVLEVACE